MNKIAERAAAAVTSRLTDKVVSAVTDDGTEKAYEQAVEQERRARAKAIARAAADDSTPTASGGESGATPPAIQELMDDEDCPVCESILAALAEMDEPRRTRGIADYGEFRKAIEESEEAAESVLEGSEVLVDALNELPGGSL